MSSSSIKKVGVKDIAALAGVSIGTVDRVLHNRGDVRESTREKVLSIVDELGYTPNILAKSLSSKKRTRLAIVIPDSSDDNPYWKIPIKGIERAVIELEQYNTDIIYDHFDASRKISFADTLEKVCDASPDGIVLNPVFKDVSLQFLKRLDEKSIPFVFIDGNIPGTNSLGYFGQDARQSGAVAGRLMHLALGPASNILVVKQTNRKVFSQHIESRVEGFLDYMHVHCQEKQNIEILEIDLLNANEPADSIERIVNKRNPFHGFLVPNSRAFRLSEFLSLHKDFRPFIVGYDLLEENIQLLERNVISCLISQKPDVQAYHAITALFDHMISRKKVNQSNFSTIDIIFKENLQNYLNND